MLAKPARDGQSWPRGRRCERVAGKRTRIVLWHTACNDL